MRPMRPARRAPTRIEAASRGRARGAVGRALLAPGIGTGTTLALRTLHAFVHRAERLVGRGEARALTDDEVAALRPVFADSIDYDAVTVRGRGVKARLGLRAHVVRDDVWLPEDCFDAHRRLTPRGLRTLLHEAVHVWQYRTRGDGYIAEALSAQLVHGARGVGTGQAYDWVAAALRGTRFEAMNPEAQAELGCWIGLHLGTDGEVDRDALGARVGAAYPTSPRRSIETALDVAAEAHAALRGAHRPRPPLP